MNDRELLELAAKAAGIKGKWGKEKYIEQNEGFMPRGWLRAWNPLHDQDDAFGLLLKLPIKKALIAVAIGHEDSAYGRRTLCRAITNAAAEIGKAMP